MLDKLNINIKNLLAFIICLVAIPLARFISPQMIIDGNLIYIAWLPISVMFSVIFIFGRYAIAPLISRLPSPIAFIKFNAAAGVYLTFCQLFAVLSPCAILATDGGGSAGAGWSNGKTYGGGSSGAASSRRCSWKITMYLPDNILRFH